MEINNNRNFIEEAKQFTETCREKDPIEEKISSFRSKMRWMGALTGGFLLPALDIVADLKKMDIITLNRFDLKSMAFQREFESSDRTEQEEKMLQFQSETLKAISFCTNFQIVCKSYVQFCNAILGTYLFKQLFEKEPVLPGPIFASLNVALPFYFASTITYYIMMRKTKELANELLPSPRPAEIAEVVETTETTEIAEAAAAVEEV